MPSDHVIADVAAFHAAIEAAMPLVADGWLVTFGIAPDAPETGYGWIQVGEPLADGRPPRRALRREAAARPGARRCWRRGDHAWNGGIFLFRADIYLDALAQSRPGHADRDAGGDGQGAARGRRGSTPMRRRSPRRPTNSIDYAVMEKAERVAVVPVAMGWSDVGSWDALHAISETRRRRQRSHRGDVLAIDTKNCFVRSDGVRVSLVGVEDLIVVASGNDVLILPRGRSQEVKKLIEAMKRGLRSVASGSSQANDVRRSRQASRHRAAARSGHLACGRSVAKYAASSLPASVDPYDRSDGGERR